MGWIVFVVCMAAASVLGIATAYAHNIEWLLIVSNLLLYISGPAFVGALVTRENNQRRSDSRRL